MAVQKLSSMGLVIVFCTLSTVAHAALCTQSTIEHALASRGSFIWSQECSNAIISVNKPIIVGSNKMVDGSGKMIIKWTGKHPCDEKPSDQTVFTMMGSNSVLKNFAIQWSPEGIHLRGNNNVVQGITFQKICEDGLTNYGNNNTILNSYFNDAPDKCIQTNGGSATFEGNVFRKCPRAIGSCSDKADPGNHPMANCKVASFNTARNNRVEGCSGGYGFRSSGKKSKKANGWLKASNNTFNNCKFALQTEEDGVVYASGNKIKGGGAFRNKHTTGKIYDCQNMISGAVYSEGKKPIKSCSF